jgi:hypothetical protein
VSTMVIRVAVTVVLMVYVCQVWLTAPGALSRVGITVRDEGPCTREGSHMCAALSLFRL